MNNKASGGHDRGMDKMHQFYMAGLMAASTNSQRLSR